MTRASALAFGVALVVFSADAHGQELVEGLRIQGGYITEQRPPPTERLDDWWIGAVPSLTLLWGERATQFSLNYTLTGALHSLGGASEISNRVTLALAHALSRRTTLYLSGSATQSTLSNLLISEPAAGTTNNLFPSPSTRLVTATVRQGLTHQLTPRVSLSQGADASFFTVLPPTPPADTFFGGLDLGAEHSWQHDAVGVSARGTYTNLHSAQPGQPLLIQHLVSITAGPTWRHDWSRSINTSVAAGAVLLLAPDTAGAEPVVAPSGRATLQYTVDAASASLNYATGYFASPLTGQGTLSHRASLNIAMPLSEHREIYVGFGGGYLRASLIDLRDSTNDQDFDGFFGDADLTWQATSIMSVFARYQAVAQIGDVNAIGVNPSFIRDVFLVGVSLSSRPHVGMGGPGNGFGTVPLAPPQRVDGADGARRPEDRDQHRDDRRNPRDEDEQREQREDDRGIVPAPAPKPQDPSRGFEVKPTRPTQPSDD